MSNHGISTFWKEKSKTLKNVKQKKKKEKQKQNNTKTK